MQYVIPGPFRKTDRWSATDYRRNIHDSAAGYISVVVHTCPYVHTLYISREFVHGRRLVSSNQTTDTMPPEREIPAPRSNIPPHLQRKVGISPERIARNAISATAPRRLVTAQRRKRMLAQSAGVNSVDPGSILSSAPSLSLFPSLAEFFSRGNMRKEQMCPRANPRGKRPK